MSQYRFTENRNFEDYAGGRVFYAHPGHPAFPVRLASEIFQRVLVHWRAAGGDGLCTLYDPTCGGAYWLAVLAYLHWDDIDAIYAPDVDADVLPQAERNLSLLTLPGLDRRIAEIERMRTDYGKESHTEALQSAHLFRQQIQANLRSHSIPTTLFHADATDPVAIYKGLVGGQQVDIVIADVPYGWHSDWQVANGQDQPPVEQMLRALHPLIKPDSMVAIAAGKRQKIRHEAYQCIERFQVGKRQIVLLRMDDDSQT